MQPEAGRTDSDGVTLRRLHGFQPLGIVWRESNVEAAAQSHDNAVAAAVVGGRDRRWAGITQAAGPHIGPLGLITAHHAIAPILGTGPPSQHPDLPQCRLGLSDLNHSSLAAPPVPEARAD